MEIVPDRQQLFQMLDLLKLRTLIILRLLGLRELLGLLGLLGLSHYLKFRATSKTQSLPLKILVFTDIMALISMVSLAHL